MAAPKGHPKWGGRVAGTKNLVHRAAVDYINMVVGFMDDNEMGLVHWAMANPTEFWTKVFKLIVPKEIKLDAEVTTMSAEFAARLATVLGRPVASPDDGWDF
jgi:hypothetical protein